MFHKAAQVLVYDVQLEPRITGVYSILYSVFIKKLFLGATFRESQLLSHTEELSLNIINA